MQCGRVGDWPLEVGRGEVLELPVARDEQVGLEVGTGRNADVVCGIRG